MDKTSSTSSSTAAAVADSASAAASSKTTTNNSSATMTATVSATSVKLLIKASNQQFDDQIIESDLLWTVKRLKTQLSLVYPSKPPVSDQKLIYSGQLLQDTLQLKDVIRSYKDVYTHNHIFHLVYTPKYVLPPLKSKMPSSMSNNTDGLRQRNVPGSTAQQQKQLPQQQSQQVDAAQQQQQQQQQQQYAQPQFPLQYTFTPTWTATQLTGTSAAAQACPPFGDPNSGGGSVSGTGNNPTLPFSLPGQFHMQAMATQQAAMYNWMQHVYTQYMDQCARLTNLNAHGLHSANANTTANSSSSDANADVNAASGGAYGLPPSHPFLQQFPYFIPNPAMPSTTPVIPAFPPSATIINNNNNNNVGGVPAASDVQQQQQQAQVEQLPEQQLQQQQQQPAAPRFPNIAQDEQDNRDWLDSFFSITRLAIFLTILYFNSSPLRCLVVVIIAGGIYLYHIGVFRLRQERNNNNINRNNNTPLADQAQRQRQQREREANAEAAPVAAVAANTEAGNNADGDANPPQNGTDNNSAAAAATAAVAGDVIDAANDNNNATEPLLPNAGVAATATPNTTSADENTGVVDGDDQNNNANSVISFVRTFVVTFFTSLLPETPAL